MRMSSCQRRVPRVTLISVSGQRCPSPASPTRAGNGANSGYNAGSGQGSTKRQPFPSLICESVDPVFWSRQTASRLAAEKCLSRYRATGLSGNDHQQDLTDGRNALPGCRDMSQGRGELSSPGTCGELNFTPENNSQHNAPSI